MKKNTARSIQSVDRAIDILMLFRKHEDTLGISDMSEKLGLPKTTIQGIVNTLAQRNFLEKNEGTAKYRLGGTIFFLGMKYNAFNSILQECETFMERLAFKYRESVDVAMMTGASISIVMRYAAGRINITHPQGSPVLPTHATCLGKIFLAYTTEDHLNRILDCCEFERHTPNTITSREELIRAVDEVRRTGISYDNEEYITGFAGVGGPILSASGFAVAAFAVFGTADRIYLLKNEIIEDIRYTSSQLSSKLNIQVD